MVTNPAIPPYVEQIPSGDWRIVGVRVSLESVITAYWEGQSPEAIRQSYPSLSAEQIYGVIAFYLHNRRELDAYLQTQTAIWEQLQRDSEVRNSDLLSRIRVARTAAGAVRKSV